MTNEQLLLNGEQARILLTKEEEQFLIETEKVENSLPSFDALALKQMGLSEQEIQLIQVFFTKARACDFTPHRFVKSECVRGLISALEYLPRTDGTGAITLESYKASDNLYHFSKNMEEKNGWSDKFRYEFGHAVIYSHKEKVKPVLLDILQKVFDWIVEFQKKHGIYHELPAWLQDGMRGDFTSDNWIGSDLYEGEKKPNYSGNTPQEVESQTQPPKCSDRMPKHPAENQISLFSTSAQEHPREIHPSVQEPPATEKQKALLRKLLQERNIESPDFDIERLTKKEASRHIDMMLKRGSRHRAVSVWK